MRKRAGKVADAGNFAKQRVALRVLERVVTNTPVDTTKALSNWQVTTTTPIMHEIEAHVPAEGGMSIVPSTAITMQLGATIIATSRPGVPIILSNVTDYIYDLAYMEKSLQGPFGWLERAIDLGRRQGMQEAAAKRKL